jgi:hypothetical protein
MRWGYGSNPSPLENRECCCLASGKADWLLLTKPSTIDGKARIEDTVSSQFLVVSLVDGVPNPGTSARMRLMRPWRFDNTVASIVLSLFSIDHCRENVVDLFVLLKIT